MRISRVLRVCAAVIGALAFSARECRAGQLIALVNFDGANGSNPAGSVALDSQGNMFGTTQGGGAYGEGTVWELNRSTGQFTTLVSFNNADGAQPIAGVTFDNQGNIYGTTYRGGTYGAGTVWELNTATGQFTSLVNFNGANGANPFYGNVAVDRQGNVYGTTAGGGANGAGTVWEINHATGFFSTLVNFNGTNGAGPGAGVTLDSQGNLYGTTSAGGPYPDGGTIWEINHSTGQLSTILATSYGIPVGGVAVDNRGNIYGTTATGAGFGGGSVFVLDPSGMQIAGQQFNFSNGFDPVASPTLDGLGNAYGTTQLGGANDDGVVWQLSQSTGQLVALASFNVSTGVDPVGGVTFDSQGNMYGTTQYGGEYGYANGMIGYGTIWELTASPVPEPSSVALLGVGGIFIAAYGLRPRSRRKKKGISPIMLRFHC